MKLYSYFRSSAAYRVRIALNLKGLDHELIPVSLVRGGGEHLMPAYRKLNPQMLVPFLEDGAVSIGQSMAILEYLEDIYPNISLLPSDPEGRARVRHLANIVCCDVHPLNNLRVMRYLETELGVSEEDRNRWYAHWIEAGFTAFEETVSRSPVAGRYSYGDAVSLADVCLVPQVYNACRFKVPLDSFPRILGIEKACATLEPFLRAAPENQPDAPTS